MQHPASQSVVVPAADKGKLLDVHGPILLAKVAALALDLLVAGLPLPVCRVVLLSFANRLQARGHVGIFLVEIVPLALDLFLPVLQLAIGGIIELVLALGLLFVLLLDQLAALLNPFISRLVRSLGDGLQARLHLAGLVLKPVPVARNLVLAI